MGSVSLLWCKLTLIMHASRHMQVLSGKNVLTLTSTGSHCHSCTASDMTMPCIASFSSHIQQLTALERQASPCKFWLIMSWKALLSSSLTPNDAHSLDTCSFARTPHAVASTGLTLPCSDILAACPIICFDACCEGTAEEGRQGKLSQPGGAAVPTPSLTAAS